MSGVAAHALALLRVNDRREALLRLVEAQPDAGTAAATALLIAGYDDYATVLLECAVETMLHRTEMDAAGGLIADTDAAYGQTATPGPISGDSRPVGGLAGPCEHPGASEGSGGASEAVETRAGETITNGRRSRG